MRNFDNIEDQAKYADGDKYDFIIVGGGTAGCLIASELVKYNVTVLLVEAGGYPPFETLYPAYFTYPKHTVNDWNVTSTREEIFKYHKSCYTDITQGKMLGGSSSLNYIEYARGNYYDYDNWAAFTNDSSWSYKSILPLICKSEGLIDKKVLNSPNDRALHGLYGKWKIRKYYFPIIDKYFTAFKEIGNKIVVDINEKNPVGFTAAMFSMGKKERSSSATFLKSHKNKRNLNVLINSLVTKIIFDDKNIATGVKIKTKDGKIITVKAEKEVIVTAGVFKSPQLLMVSGIGPKHHLKKKKIKVIKDLPVGQNLQDHSITVLAYKMGKAKVATGPINPHVLPIPVIAGYVALNKSQNIPDYEIIGLIIDNPEAFLQVCAILFSFTNEVCATILKGAAGKQIFYVYNLLKYPKSRGLVLLNTTNMEDQPLITTGYFNDDRDVEMQVKTTMNFNAVLNTTYFKSVDAELIDPKLESCAGLDKNSKEYWRCYVKGMVLVGHYFAGTCAMESVVDSKLLVKGFKNLRVADASIMPNIVGTLPLATILMVAQKTVINVAQKYCLE